MAELQNAGRFKSFVYRNAPARVKEWLADKEAVARITQRLEAPSSFDRYVQEVSAPGSDMEAAWQAHQERMGVEPDKTLTESRPTEVGAENEAAKEIAEDTIEEPDWEKMSNEMVEAKITRNHVLFEHHDELGRLHRDPTEGPAKSIVEYRDDVSSSRRDIYAVHGEITAQSTHESSRDEEGSRYKETWFNKDNQIHRDGNDPAVIIRDEHYIPDETYLDESRQEIWKNGIEVSSTDTTWEDIVQHKGLTPNSLMWMGYEPNEPSVTQDAPGRDAHATAEVPRLSLVKSDVPMIDTGKRASVRSAGMER